jgi:hypothetical protein
MSKRTPLKAASPNIAITIITTALSLTITEVPADVVAALATAARATPLRIRAKGLSTSPT